MPDGTWKDSSYVYIYGASNYGEEVTVPGVVKYEGKDYTITQLGSIFCNNQTLKKVTLPKSVTSLSSTFDGCTLLSEVVNTEQILSCSYAFNNCSSLKSIDLSNCETIEGGCTFYGCKKLQSIKLEKCTTIAPQAFIDCSSLQSVGDLSSCTTIGKEAFRGCSSLRSIDISSCTSLGEEAFADCSKLEEVKLSKQLNKINNGTFSRCTKLKSIDLNNCTYIGSTAFIDCSYLDNVSIPNTIKYMGYKCFNGNITLTLYAKDVPTLDGERGDYPNIDNYVLGENVVIVVPEESIEAYQTANVWNTMSEKIFPMGTQFEYDVETTAQASTSGLQKAIGEKNLKSVVTLKVKGSINSYDIMVIRNKMDNLHHLDLSDADIKSNTYQYYTGYSTQDDILGPYSFANLSKLLTVKLPKSVKYIDQAFNYCSQLRSVEMPENLICIGDKYDEYWFYGTEMENAGAFKNCFHLKDIIFHNCERLEGNSFRNCLSIQEVSLPKNLKHIGSYAFYNCSQLKDIILPSEVDTISYGAFRICTNLASVQFPPSLKSIETEAFDGCSNLSSINLPGLTNISERVFLGCSNLKEVKLPSTLERIGDNAFENCTNLTKVYTYTVLPINIDQNTFTNFKATTLYVPTQSYDNYYWSTQWGQFKEIKEFDEPYTYIYLDNEFTLEKRFEGTPDIDIKNNGALTVNGKENQDAGEVTVKGDGNNSAGTLITDGNLDAKKLRFDITVNANQWYFFSFPFDINLADIKTPGKYVFRKYNGSLRADQGTGGWVDLASDETTLKQGVGYIFQTAQSGNLTLRVTKEKFGKLDANNIVKDLSSYPSADEQNASWNFIGNPQISYMDAASLGYNAPITYWNGDSYEAVRPGDDEFALQPFQAFFVQKPVDVSNIEFKAEDRITKSESINKQNNARARRIGRGINPERLLINLTLSDGNHTDKTRVVFNDKKSQAYELDCDAAKFAAINDAPQFYTIEAKAGNLAINERPMGSVKLGFAAKKAGNFTISAKRMDQPMLLQDNQTGATYDLTEGDYQFASNAGTFENRFVLVPSRGTTGIADIVKKTGINIMPTDAGINLNGVDGKKVTIYAADGTMLASRTFDGMLNLMKGVYIVKIDNLSTKVMVK